MALIHLVMFDRSLLIRFLKILAILPEPAILAILAIPAILTIPTIPTIQGAENLNCVLNTELLGYWN